MGNLRLEGSKSAVITLRVASYWPLHKENHLVACNISTVYNRSSYVKQGMLVEAYAEWFSSWIEAEYDLYLISFMFKPIRGSEATQLKIMASSLEAFYRTLVTRVVRRPRSASIDLLPRLIAHPDLPIRKRAKISLADATINGGLHFQAVIALPPQSRLRESLDDHLATYLDLYCPPEGRLARIHVVSVTEKPQKAVRYALKMAERGRFGLEHTVVLPRSRSEVGLPQ